MQCHEYLLELIDAPLNDAPLDAVGRLTAGSAFFSTGETERWIRDTRLLDPADAAPYWRNGYISMICVAAVLSGWLFVVKWVSRICWCGYKGLSGFC